MVTASQAPDRARLLTPTTILGAVLSLVLVAVLLSIGDITKAAALVWRFPLENLLVILALLGGYEATRFAQWSVMMRRLDPRTDWRQLLFSFSGAEATKSLPGGNYFQNYLLRRTRGTDVAYSSAATTSIIWMEVVAALLTLAVLGVPGWWWLRPACLALLGGIAYVVAIMIRKRRSPERPEWLERRRLGRWLLERAETFRAGTRDLLTPTTAAAGLALAFAYLLFAGIAFTVVVRGVGVEQASIQHGVVAYMAGLAAGLVLPIPVDLGLAELGGMGALLALGMNREAALAAVVVNRIAGLAVGLLVAVAVGVALREQWRSVVRD